MAVVRIVREQSEGDDNVIEPIVLTIFIHNLIVGSETAQAKSRQIFAKPSPISYFVLTAFCIMFFKINMKYFLFSIIYDFVKNFKRHFLV